MAPGASVVEGYEAFFGLKEAPFSLAPDPRFLFASASHSAALQQVAYALERREPLVVVTGEIGTGKTLLCRTVLQRLERKTFLSVISDPLLERDDLLKQLLQDFGVISKDRTRQLTTTRHELVDALNDFLRSLSPIEAHAVVVIDEAQHLQPDVLEQIRLLSNADDGKGTLLQIVLVGQSDLDALLGRPELRQLQQRVSRRFRLESLNGAEVRAYIGHRIDLARDATRWSEGVSFTPEAIDAITQLSGGLPRVINLLCDRALEEGYRARVHAIDRTHVQEAARLLGIGSQGSQVSQGSASSHGSVGSQGSQSSLGSQDSVDSWASGTPSPVPKPSISWRPIALAAAVVVAAAVVWLGVRSASSPPRATAPSVPAARPPAAPPSATQPAAPPPSSSPQPATPPSSAAPSSPAPATSSSAALAGDHFDILVASFRTETRASAVAAEVSALGLPTRRRALDAWQQVIAGPFASRAEADAAQQRLNGAGITGTQIVAVPR